MAQLKTMYPAQANTPETTLAGSLTTTGTSVTVLDGSVLPDAPNYLTIGADSATAETVLMTAKDGNDLTITRGQNGTAARAWGKGDIIGRYFTAADHDALRENIKTLNTEKPDRVASPSTGTLSRSTERPARRKIAERKRRISPPQIIPTTARPTRCRARPPATLQGWTRAATSRTAERKPPTLPPRRTRTRVTRRSRFLRTCPSPPPRGGTTPPTEPIRSRLPSRRRA